MEADLKRIQKERETTAKDMQEEEALWHQSRARVEVRSCSNTSVSAERVEQKVLSMHELAINLEAAACSYDVSSEETQESQLTQVCLINTLLTCSNC